MYHRSVHLARSHAKLYWNSLNTRTSAASVYEPEWHSVNANISWQSLDTRPDYWNESIFLTVCHRRRADSSFGGYMQFIKKIIIVGINVFEWKYVGAAPLTNTQPSPKLRDPHFGVCLLFWWKICLYLSPWLCARRQNDILLITTIWNDYTVERVWGLFYLLALLLVARRSVRPRVPRRLRSFVGAKNRGSTVKRNTRQRWH